MIGISETSVHTAAFTRQSETAKIRTSTLATRFFLQGRPGSRAARRRFAPRRERSMGPPPRDGGAERPAGHTRCYSRQPPLESGERMVTIRAATEADLASCRSSRTGSGIATIPASSASSRSTTCSNAAMRRRRSRTSSRAPGSGLVLARVDDVPVGFAAWYRPSEPATTKLDKLYVLQEYHAPGHRTAPDRRMWRRLRAPTGRRR